MNIIDKCKFAGVVTGVIDEHSFIFRADNNVKCQIGQIVGLDTSNNIYILASIEKVDIDFFLTKSQEYFTSIASDNKLRELSKGIRSPKYSQLVRANIIGIFEYKIPDNHFIESNISINSYTPNIFQEVILFDFNHIETVYGLKQNISDYFKIGTFLYPNYSEHGTLPEVNISAETFNSHTLISGVTGSGKSRLTALLANQLAIRDGHITIIDPHDEYIDFADAENTKITFFSNHQQTHNDKKNVIRRGFSLSLDYLTPSILLKLLPALSEAQYEYLCVIFNDIANDNFSKKNTLTLKKVIDTTIQKFNADYKEDGHSPEILNKAQQFAKEDANYLAFIKRYIWYLNREWSIGKSRPAKTEVAFALLKRLIDIFEEELFINNPNPTPLWLDYSQRNIINIMKVVYDSNLNSRRFVNTIIQCFFTPQLNHRILIIDEAHLLLNERKEELGTLDLLSRLLRESRKYKLSIFFITQNEEDVPEELRSQFQNKFKFREEKDDTLRYLDNQTCLCSIYKGKLNFPMRVVNVDKV